MSEATFTAKNVQLRIFGYRDETAPLSRPDIVKMFFVVALLQPENQDPALDAISTCLSSTVMEIFDNKRKATQFTEFERS